ncbi:MAG TPA: hypothetical protein VNE39_23630 [Planctomycetota bacterium]|nr:hypothetical protein [Planctomycetota bacterium]
MPDRLLNALLALAGVLMVAALALLGRDVLRAAGTGPRWRRRLVGGGLSLLAALGVPACGSSADAPAAKTAPDPKPLADTPEWQRTEATWREADEIASGKRGPYPFDAAGKKRVLAALETAGKDIEALQSNGSLGAAAAGLLRQDLALLVRGVQEKRPTEMRMATCYEPMAFTPVQDSMARLTARLPLLEKLAAAGRVQPQVVAKVLLSVERDIATLADEKLLSPLPQPDRLKVEGIRNAAADLAAKLKAAVGD